MKSREMNIAKEFNIIDKIEKLENELLQVKGVTEVEFDLSGFYDNLNEVIVLIKYSIYDTETYYKKRKELKEQVVGIAKGNFLTRTSDRIEDYGEHFYFVFHCFNEWTNNK